MNWRFVIAALLAAQFVLVLSVSAAVGFWQIPPLLPYTTVAAVMAIGAFVGFVAWNLRSLPANPIEHLRSANWPVFADLAFGIVFANIQFTLLTWSKTLIPFVTGYWADPMLADVEAMLFFGVDPWLLLPAPDLAVDYLYRAWIFVLFGSLSAVCLSSSPAKGNVLVAWFLTMGVGCVVGQYLLPSAGPIFFDRLGYGDRFSGLQTGEFAVFASDYLWAQYEAGESGFAAGISAMPSGHVATSFWIFLAARRLAPRLAVPAFLFFLSILFASVMLGWHYALDGVAGALIALAVMRLTETRTRTSSTDSRKLPSARFRSAPG